MFLININPVSNMSDNLLDISSGCVGPYRFLEGIPLNDLYRLLRFPLKLKDIPKFQRFQVSKFQSFRLLRIIVFRVFQIQKLHFIFLIHINPVSKISNNLLDKSSGCVGPRLFQHLRTFRCPNMWAFPN